MNSPVMTYKEKRLHRTTTFILRSRTLTIEVSALLGPSGTCNVDLAKLDPKSNTLLVRDEIQSGMLFLGIAASMLAGLIIMYRFWGHRSAFVLPWLICCVVAVVLNHIFARRIEYRIFNYHSGVTAFAVGRVGKFEADFDSFLQALANEIGTQYRSEQCGPDTPRPCGTSDASAAGASAPPETSGGI